MSPRVARLDCAAAPAPAAADPSSLKSRLAADMKQAMKDKAKGKLSAVRAIQTAIKQKEVDERVVVSDDEAIAIMAKLVKQRKESIASYLQAGRQDLVDVEEEEVKYIAEYMPKQMDSSEVDAAVADAIAKAEAKTVKDMGKVMAILRPLLAGKADMSAVGDKIKKALSA